ncbi:MAG: ISNCY family transposase [Clostridia bacterium]
MKEYVFTMDELKKLRIINRVLDKSIPQKEAALLLGISDRQVRNILVKVRLHGPDGVKHQNKFHQPIQTHSDESKRKIIELKLSYNYSASNFLHFQELLEERESIFISYSALHGILTEHGIKSPRKHRKKQNHPNRKRKDHYGELIQTDATPFEWFEDGTVYSLHGYIDDATGEVLGLYMCKSECLLGYLEITRQMLENVGSPQAIYSDKYSVFFPTSSSKNKLSIDEELEGKEEPVTQYHRILDELGVELRAASTSQAKGRVERLWETLQGRLVTEFRIHGITTPEQANEFFPEYIKCFNKKFSVKPLSDKSLFVEVPTYLNLDLLLTNRLTRRVNCSGVFSINNKKFQILDNDIIASATIKIHISHQIGIVAVYKDRCYRVIPLDNLPHYNSTKDLEKAYQQSSIEILAYAIAFCSVDAKLNNPTLLSY